MEILVNNQTTPRQLRAIAKLFIELAGDEPQAVTLTDATPAIKEVAKGYPELTPAPQLDPPIQVGRARVGPNPYAMSPTSASQTAVTAAVNTAPNAPSNTTALSPSAWSAAPPVDKTGRAWNAASDSSSKAINADGTWRRKKGLDDAAYRAALGQTSIPVPPHAAAPVTLVPPPPPPTDTGAGPVSFPQLMAWAGPHIAAKRLSSDQLNEACRTADASLQNLQHLIQNQSFVPAVHAVLQGFVNRAMGVS